MAKLGIAIMAWRRPDMLEACLAHLWEILFRQLLKRAGLGQKGFMNETKSTKYNPNIGIHFLHHRILFALSTYVLSGNLSNQCMIIAVIAIPTIPNTAPPIAQLIIR